MVIMSNKIININELLPFFQYVADRCGHSGEVLVRRSVGIIVSAAKDMGGDGALDAAFEAATHRKNFKWLVKEYGDERNQNDWKGIAPSNYMGSYLQRYR